MRSYLREISGFGADIRLFLVYNLMANIGFGVFQIVFNLYLLKLNLREDDIGVFLFAQTMAMGAGGFLLGYLVNKLGSWRCVSWGFVVFLAASTGISFAESRFLIIALSAVYGLGLSFLFNTTMPFLLEWGERRKQAHSVAVSFSLISLSITIGSLVGGLMPEWVGIFVHGVKSESLESYRYTMLIGTALAGTGLIPLWLMPEARNNKRAQTETTIREPVNADERRRVQMDVRVFVVAGGFMSLGVGMVIPFYNVYLESLGADTRRIGFVFAIGGAFAAVIGLGAPALTRRLGALNAAAALRLTIVPAFAMLIVFPSLPLAITAFLIRQATFSMAWPIDSTFIGELLPPKARGSVFGLRSGVWNLVSALAALIAGKIIVRTGYDWTFASIVGFTALSAIVFTIYYRKHPHVRAGMIPSAVSMRVGTG